MQTVFIILMALFTALSVFIEKNLYNPAVIFNSVWTLVAFLASLEAYDLYSVSLRTYIVVFIGVCAFNIGFICRNAAKIGFKTKHSQEYMINYKFLIAFYGVITLFTAYLASSSIRLILSGTSMEVIRFNYSNIENGMVIRSAIAYRFEMYVVAASEFAAIALLPIVFSEKKDKNNIILLGELILFLVLHMFVTGARSFLIDIVVLFLVYFLMNKEISKNILKKLTQIKIPKIVVIIIAVGAIGLVILMTMLRKGDRKETSIMREIYRYFAISFPLLDIHLDMSSPSDYTHGWTLVYGLIRPPLSMLHAVGVPFPSGLDEAMRQITANDDFYRVGGGKANSFVTVFYYNYMDFGMFSMILYSFIYGYAAQCVYCAVKRNPNIKNQTFYLIISIGLFLSFARSCFAAYRYVYAFFILALAFRKKPLTQEVKEIIQSIA